MTKNTNFSNFHRFYALFVKVATDFIYWNDLKGNKEKIGCSVVFYEDIIAMDRMKVSQTGTENHGEKRQECENSTRRTRIK